MEIVEERIRNWLEQGDLEEILDLSNINVYELLNIPQTVVKLKCTGNFNLQKINDLPNVIELDCSHNNISRLPSIPNVKILNCSSNIILTQLPELPNVVILNCSNNQISTLPDLPNVETLICHNNLIQTLVHLIDKNKLKKLSYSKLFFNDDEIRELNAIPNIDIMIVGRHDEVENNEGDDDDQYVYEGEHEVENNEDDEYDGEYDEEFQKQVSIEIDKIKEMEEYEITEELQDEYKFTNSQIQEYNSFEELVNELANQRVLKKINKEQEEKKDVDRYNSLDNTTEQNLENICDNKQDDITLEPLNTKKGVVTLISIGSEKYHYQCFELDKLRKIFKESNKIYEWNKSERKPYLEKQVYKLPWRGDFIDVDSFNRLKYFNTFVIMPRDERVYLGSRGGVSRMHGEEVDRHTVNILKPIHRSTFLNREKLSIYDLFNFKPRLEDYNPYYLKYKDIDW